MKPSEILNPPHAEWLVFEVRVWLSIVEEYRDEVIADYPNIVGRLDATIESLRACLEPLPRKDDPRIAAAKEQLLAVFDEAKSWDLVLETAYMIKFPLEVMDEFLDDLQKEGVKDLPKNEREEIRDALMTSLNKYQSMLEDMEKEIEADQSDSGSSEDRERDA